MKWFILSIGFILLSVLTFQPVASAPSDCPLIEAYVFTQACDPPLVSKNIPIGTITATKVELTDGDWFVTYHVLVQDPPTEYEPIELLAVGAQHYDPVNLINEYVVQPGYEDINPYDFTFKTQITPVAVNGQLCDFNTDYLYSFAVTFGYNDYEQLFEIYSGCDPQYDNFAQICWNPTPALVPDPSCASLSSTLSSSSSSSLSPRSISSTSSTSSTSSSTNSILSSTHSFSAPPSSTISSLFSSTTNKCSPIEQYAITMECNPPLVPESTPPGSITATSVQFIDEQWVITYHVLVENQNYGEIQYMAVAPMVNILAINIIEDYVVQPGYEDINPYDFTFTAVINPTEVNGQLCDIDTETMLSVYVVLAYDDFDEVINLSSGCDPQYATSPQACWDPTPVLIDQLCSSLTSSTSSTSSSNTPSTSSFLNSSSFLTTSSYSSSSSLLSTSSFSNSSIVPSTSSSSFLDSSSSPNTSSYSSSSSTISSLFSSTTNTCSPIEQYAITMECNPPLVPESTPPGSITATSVQFIDEQWVITYHVLVENQNYGEIQHLVVATMINLLAIYMIEDYVVQPGYEDINPYDFTFTAVINPTEVNGQLCDIDNDTMLSVYVVLTYDDFDEEINVCSGCDPQYATSPQACWDPKPVLIDQLCSSLTSSTSSTSSSNPPSTSSFLNSSSFLSSSSYSSSSSLLSTSNFSNSSIIPSTSSSSFLNSSSFLTTSSYSSSSSLLSTSSFSNSSIIPTTSSSIIPTTSSSSFLNSSSSPNTSSYSSSSSLLSTSSFSNSSVIPSTSSSSFLDSSSSPNTSSYSSSSSSHSSSSFTNSSSRSNTPSISSTSSLSNSLSLSNSSSFSTTRSVLSTSISSTGPSNTNYLSSSRSLRIPSSISSSASNLLLPNITLSSTVSLSLTSGSTFFSSSFFESSHFSSSISDVRSSVTTRQSLPSPTDVSNSSVSTSNYFRSSISLSISSPIISTSKFISTSSIWITTTSSSNSSNILGTSTSGTSTSSTSTSSTSTSNTSTSSISTSSTSTSSTSTSSTSTASTSTSSTSTSSTSTPGLPDPSSPSSLSYSSSLNSSSSPSTSFSSTDVSSIPRSSFSSSSITVRPSSSSYPSTLIPSVFDSSTSTSSSTTSVVSSTILNTIQSSTISYSVSASSDLTCLLPMTSGQPSVGKRSEHLVGTLNDCTMICKGIEASLSTCSALRDITDEITSCILCGVVYEAVQDFINNDLALSLTSCGFPTTTNLKPCPVYSTNEGISYSEATKLSQRSNWNGTYTQKLTISTDVTRENTESVQESVIGTLKSTGQNLVKQTSLSKSLKGTSTIETQYSKSSAEYSVAIDLSSTFVKVSTRESPAVVITETKSSPTILTELGGTNTYAHIYVTETQFETITETTVWSFFSDSHETSCDVTASKQGVTKISGATNSALGSASESASSIEASGNGVHSSETTYSHGNPHQTGLEPGVLSELITGTHLRTTTRLATPEKTGIEQSNGINKVTVGSSAFFGCILILIVL